MKEMPNAEWQRLENRLDACEKQLETMRSSWQQRLERVQTTGAHDEAVPVEWLEEARTPSRDLSELVGSGARPVEQLVQLLAQCDLEELRDEPFSTLARARSPLLLCLAVLNEAGVIKQRRALVSVVRVFSKPGRHAKTPVTPPRPG